MGKLVGVVALIVLTAVLGVAVLVSAVVGGGSSGGASGGTPTHPGREPALPDGWAAMEQGAAATCPGLSWSVLAAIGTVESDSGRSTAPGVASGANPAGAEGPFQFEPPKFSSGIP